MRSSGFRALVIDSFEKLILNFFIKKFMNVNFMKIYSSNEEEKYFMIKNYNCVKF